MALQKTITVLFIWHLFLIFPHVPAAQEIQTYEGAFKHGKAEYQYYENGNYERVRHGPFFYSCKLAYGKYIIKKEGNPFKKY